MSDHKRFKQFHEPEALKFPLCYDANAAFVPKHPFLT